MKVSDNSKNRRNTQKAVIQHSRTKVEAGDDFDIDAPRNTGAADVTGNENVALLLFCESLDVEAVENVERLAVAECDAAVGGDGVAQHRLPRRAARLLVLLVDEDGAGRGGRDVCTGRGRGREVAYEG